MDETFKHLFDLLRVQKFVNKDKNLKNDLQIFCRHLWEELHTLFIISNCRTSISHCSTATPDFWNIKFNSNENDRMRSKSSESWASHTFQHIMCISLDRVKMKKSQAQHAQVDVRATHVHTCSGWKWVLYSFSQAPDIDKYCLSCLGMTCIMFIHGMSVYHACLWEQVIAHQSSNHGITSADCKQVLDNRQWILLKLDISFSTWGNIIFIMILGANNYRQGRYLGGIWKCNKKVRPMLLFKNLFELTLTKLCRPIFKVHTLQDRI